MKIKTDKGRIEGEKEDWYEKLGRLRGQLRKEKNRERKRREERNKNSEMRLRE